MLKFPPKNEKKEGYRKINIELIFLFWQEIARKDLESFKDQLGSLKKEVEELEGTSEELDKLYADQDEILEKVFNGSYGSEQENLLESNLDALEVQRNTVVEASFKWQQAQVMTSYAYEQLKFAVQKWQEILTIKSE